MDLGEWSSALVRRRCLNIVSVLHGWNWSSGRNLYFVLTTVTLLWSGEGILEHGRDPVSASSVVAIDNDVDGLLILLALSVLHLHSK